MKRLLLGFLLTVATFFCGYHVMAYTLMGGDDYYIQITSNGTPTRTQEKYTGKRISQYTYSQNSYDEFGKSLPLTFNAHKERPLRKGAFLKVIYDPHKKVVTQWEEVSQQKVPQKALSQLQ